MVTWPNTWSVPVAENTENSKSSMPKARREQSVPSADVNSLAKEARRMQAGSQAGRKEGRKEGPSEQF